MHIFFLKWFHFLFLLGFNVTNISLQPCEITNTNQKILLAPPFAFSDILIFFPYQQCFSRNLFLIFIILLSLNATVALFCFSCQTFIFLFSSCRYSLFCLGIYGYSVNDSFCFSAWIYKRPLFLFFLWTEFFSTLDKNEEGCIWINYLFLYIRILIINQNVQFNLVSSFN